MTPIIIEAPAVNRVAREYVLDVILRDRFGMDWEFREAENTDTRIFIEGMPGEILVEDIFLKVALEERSSSARLPSLPLAQWEIAGSGLNVELTEERVPVLFGEPWIGEEKQGVLRLGIDIFGSAFFMLSRYEELAIRERDEYDRFPATSSTAYKNSFLERPIIDEYIEILRACMQSFWPDLKFVTHEGGIVYSCDVDVPYDPEISSLRKILHRFAKDLYERWNLRMAFVGLKRRMRSRGGDFSIDPNNTFSWIFSLLKKERLVGRFYFLAPDRQGRGAGWYRLCEPFIQRLLELVHKNGHDIGLHGSFGSYHQKGQIIGEKTRLESALRRVGINKTIEWNRQHYLQWDSAETPERLESAGLRYDSSGGYADRAGFRFGTAHRFPMWCWRKMRPLKLFQEPLILMECSLLDQRYENLPHFPDARDVAEKLKKRALQFGGNFTLLWHNSYLTRNNDRRLLEYILASSSKDSNE